MGILELAAKGPVTNDDVQKLLRVSHATAARYLRALVASGALRREGARGAGVRYVVR
jgi:predicted HTH transcriptional regulator